MTSDDDWADLTTIWRGGDFMVPDPDELAAVVERQRARLRRETRLEAAAGLALALVFAFLAATGEQKELAIWVGLVIATIAAGALPAWWRRQLARAPALTVTDCNRFLRRSATFGLWFARVGCMAVYLGMFALVLLNWMKPFPAIADGASLFAVAVCAITAVGSAGVSLRSARYYRALLDRLAAFDSDSDAEIATAGHSNDRSKRR